MTRILDLLEGRSDDKAVKDEQYKQKIVSMIAAGQGPARLHQRGERPLYLVDLCRSWLEREPTKAAAWREVSDRLAVMGYSCAPGGMLLPFMVSALPEEHKAYGQEIEEKMAFTCDPGELAWTLKKMPEYAMRSFGLTRKDMEVSDDTLGGFLIPTTQGTRVIDYARARAALIQAGAREIPLPPSGNISFPRMTSDPTFTWTDPDSQSDATPSTPDLGTVRLQAKSLRGYVTLPNDLIRYSTPSAELVIRAALGGGIATAEDLAFLENAGSTIAPRGIRHFPQSAPETPTDGKVTLHVASTVGADGDVLEPEDLALIISLFEEGKDPDPPTAWMMRPAHFAVLANRRADAVNVGDKKGGWMFPMSRGELGGTLEKVVSGYRAVTTTQLTRSDTKGSATNLNVILFGNFNRCLIARAGAFSLDASPHIKFLQDKIVLRAILRTDFNMEYCPSLVITRNLLQS